MRGYSDPAAATPRPRRVRCVGIRVVLFSHIFGVLSALVASANLFTSCIVKVAQSLEWGEHFCLQLQ